MAKKKSKTPSTDSAAPRRPPTTRYFRAIIQATIPEQMEVLDYIRLYQPFEACYILHWLDKKADSEDGEQMDETTGLVKPHYHLICRVPKKITENTMSGRFGNYVHFQRCTDPNDAALYLTHEVFRARHKHLYPRDLVEGDKSFYNDLLGDSSNVQYHCDEWLQTLKDCNYHLQTAFYAVMKSGNKGLIKSIMSHSFFYKTFFPCKDFNSILNEKGGEK